MKNLLWLFLWGLTLSLAAADRRGNVYFAGEEVVIAPFDSALRYKICDIDGNELVRDPASASLGKLPCGYYQIEYRTRDNQVRQDSICVLPEPLPVLDENNPVAVDGALFYTFYRAKTGSLKIDYTIDDAVKMIRSANLGYSRERLWWEKYNYLDSSVSDPLIDDIVNAYAKNGIKVLQSLYGTPKDYQYPAELSSLGGRKPPVDLFNMYDYMQLLARRWPTQVQAFETWNEPEGIGGGMLSHETAATQKAAQLALSEVNPALRSFTGNGSVAKPENLLENDFNRYQNVFCFHHHEKMWNRERAVKNVAAAGTLPVWVTEVSTGSFKLDPDTGELPLSTARTQALDIPKIYARMLNANAAKLFYFFLFYHVEESQNTFGLLRQRDLMARPGFVTLANLGKILNDYESISPLKLPATLEGYRVRAKSRWIDIVWNNGPEPVGWDTTKYESACDAFGREVKLDSRYASTDMPVYFFRKNTETSPPKIKNTPDGPLCPVVLHLILPDNIKNRAADLFMLPAGETASYPLTVYNFSDHPVTGGIRVDFAGQIEEPIIIPAITVAANRSVKIPLTFRFKHSTASEKPSKMTVSGDFGAAGKSVLVADFRVLKTQIGDGDIQTAIPGWQSPGLWKKYIINDSQMTVVADSGWIIFEYDFKQAANTVVNHVWASPALDLKLADFPESAPDAVAFEIKLLAGDLPETIGLNLVETGGATYFTAIPFEADSLKKGQECLVPLSVMINPGFRKKDDNGKLDIEKICSLELPVWSKPQTKLKLAVRNLRWVNDEKSGDAAIKK